MSRSPGYNSGKEGRTVKIRQLGSAVGGGEVRQHLTTFIIDDAVAIDAGALGLLSPVAQQKSIKHVLLSHSHIDHLATLPMFLDNVFAPGTECPAVYAGGDVWDALRRDVFNERLWPDLARIGSEEVRFFTETELHSETPIRIGGLTITPVAVNHTVPTLGFLIEDATTAVVIASDTGPTERIWELASQTPFREKLRAVYLECSFPNRLAWLAEKSMHLCPRQFAAEVAKISPAGAWQTIAVHLKAQVYDEIRAELASLAIPNFGFGGGDQTWVF